MKTRRLPRVRLWVEELETRVVPSTSPALPAILHSAAVTSTNWSGYGAETNLQTPQAGAVTYVSGDWIVPAVSGTGTAYSSFWVGIDGYSSSTVEQIGTDSDVVNGVPTYYAWYEMYPNPFHTITNITVSPGDKISASVTSLGNSQFALVLTDGSQTFNTTQSLSGAKLSSADWIAEAPSSGTVLPLANFGSASFSNAKATFTINGTATSGPIDSPSWQNAKINMVNRNGSLKASTSALTDDTSTSPATSSFSVTWVSSGSGKKNSGSFGRGHGHDGGHASADDLADAAFPFSVPFDGNHALPANAAPAFVNPQGLLPAVSFQASTSVPGISGFGSFATSDDDAFDMEMLPQPPQEAPAPAAQPMPMQNRNLPPAAPLPEANALPAPQDAAPRDPGAPANVEDSDAAATQAPAPQAVVRSGSLLKSLIYLFGGAGAFALFGSAAYRTRPRDERDRAIRC